MKITTFEEWQAGEIERQEWVQTHHPTSAKPNHDFLVARLVERKEIHDKFPHVLVVAADWSEHDLLTRWAFREIGPFDGKCFEHQSEYPGCPLVLATEKITEYSYLANDKRIESTEKTYSDPGEHSHEGVWKAFFLGKTDYDYGPTEYCFKYESDKERFLAAVLSFNFSEECER